ncbi:MAG TPA: hypothetical protein VGI78_09260 [Acetobacteraceae bacterium]|jgi:hypothetical protein
MAERHGQPLRYPLTADLAGVLETSGHGRAPAPGPGAVIDGGIGPAIIRFVNSRLGRALVPSARRGDAGASARVRPV